MIRKQCTWRGDEALFLILLLLSMTCFAADDQLFHGESVRVLEHVYKAAPYTIKHIVKALKGEEEDLYGSNHLILNGKPGVGKSTLALAMAYKLRWDVHRYSSRDFIKGENRNSTAAYFNELTQDISMEDDNLVFILEEIDYLLKNYNSTHHDTDTSSMCLWTMLDEIKNKRNILFIATTNGVGGFPPQIQNRFEGCVVDVEFNKDPHFIKDSLLNLLNNNKISIANEALHYLEGNLDLFEDCSFRSLIRLACQIQLKAAQDCRKEKSNAPIIIKSKHIQSAIDDYIRLKKAFAEKPYQESDFDMRERHHTQMMEQNNRQFWMHTAIGGVGILLTIGGIVIALRSAEMQEFFHKQNMDFQHALQCKFIEAQGKMSSQSRNEDRLESTMNALIDLVASIPGMQVIAAPLKARVALSGLWWLFNRFKGG